jgi:ribosome-associated protein
MIEVTSEISIDERELEWEFIRASGPGGQRVNKVASAVQLRFDIVNSPALPEPVKDRILRHEGKKVTQDGVLIINARRYRSQEKNRQDAIERLINTIRNASVEPKLRRATKPSTGSRMRRLEIKRRQGVKKRLRKKPSLDE